MTALVNKVGCAVYSTYSILTVLTADFCEKFFKLLNPLKNKKTIIFRIFNIEKQGDESVDRRA